MGSLYGAPDRILAVVIIALSPLLFSSGYFAISSAESMLQLWFLVEFLLWQLVDAQIQVDTPYALSALTKSILHEILMAPQIAPTQ